MNELFQTVACPLCGSSTFSILRRSTYPSSITAEELGKLYSASSDHLLMDQVVRCTSCSLQYVNPRPNHDLIIHSYASAVDPTFVAQNDARIKTFQRALRRILRRLGQDNGKGRKLLDIGCAGGAFPVAARDLGFDAMGVEPSHWMADYGRRTYGIDIRDGVLTENLFPPASFDVITLWDVVEHVPVPHEILSIIHKLLKPDGLLFVNYPDAGSVAARLLGSRWPFWLSVHLLYYTRATMGAQLKRAAFAPMWFQPWSQTLPLGYVLRRAAPYFRPLAMLPPLAGALHIDQLPLTYNMGQTLVISKKS